jgi:hypothetical protein
VQCGVVEPAAALQVGHAERNMVQHSFLQFSGGVSIQRPSGILFIGPGLLRTDDQPPAEHTLKCSIKCSGGETGAALTGFAPLVQFEREKVES